MRQGTSCVHRRAGALYPAVYSGQGQSQFKRHVYNVSKESSTCGQQGKGRASFQEQFLCLPVLTATLFSKLNGDSCHRSSEQELGGERASPPSLRDVAYAAPQAIVPPPTTKKRALDIAGEPALKRRLHLNLLIKSSLSKSVSPQDA